MAAVCRQFSLSTLHIFAESRREGAAQVWRGEEKTGGRTGSLLVVGWKIRDTSYQTEPGGGITFPPACNSVILLPLWQPLPAVHDLTRMVCPTRSRWPALATVVRKKRPQPVRYPPVPSRLTHQHLQRPSDVKKLGSALRGLCCVRGVCLVCIDWSGRPPRPNRGSLTLPTNP